MSFLSDSNNLFDFYNKYQNQIIRKYELELVMAILSYTFHQYDDAKIRFKTLSENRKGFTSFNEVIPAFSDISDKIEWKANRSGIALKSINITMLQCDNNFEGFLYDWHDRLYNVIKESNLRTDYYEDSDYYELHESRFRINQINSSVYKDYNEMLDTISKETDIILMQCHGDFNHLLHYYNDGSFRGKPTLVSINDFMNKFNSIQTPKIFMCFSCDSSRIIEKSTVPITIGCKGAFNHTLTLPYCLSFFSSLLFVKHIGDYDSIKIIHERAKILTDLFTNMKFTFHLKDLLNNE